MKYLLILGNGFSLDFLAHIKMSGEIPLTNLISYGDKLDWPVSGGGAFISFRNTPNLWILGVRPSNQAEENNRIVENIITCANAFYLKTPSARGFGVSDRRSIYIHAYHELVVYLKYLFVSFDESVKVNAGELKDWSWIKMLKSLNVDPEVESVDIITFNYDVWLERALDILEIPYDISVISGAECSNKISITKPHGSISFMHKKQMDPSAFSINYTSDYLEGEPSDFTLKMKDLGTSTPIIPLIPPAGDSERFNPTWAGKIRAFAVEKAKGLKRGDKVVLCGLSYWHVDRGEIDDLLLNVSETVDLAYINPVPPDTFDAVLTSLFSNYEHFTSAERFTGKNYND